MTYYYNRETNCFYEEGQLENITEDLVLYTEKEFNDLWNCDEFHYVAQDQETKLPRWFKVDEEEEFRVLRKKRENQCFPYINRGQLWYNHLTDEQKQELEVWYTAWLDVTETKVIPEQLSWLK